MKTINLIEKRDGATIRQYQLLERESDVFTLLLDLFDDENDFSIELIEDDSSTVYGIEEDDHVLNINHPALLKRDGASFRLNLKTSGVHYFQLSLSDDSAPVLLVTEEELEKDGQGSGLDHFLNTKLPVTFEIGSTDMLIHDVLSLKLGSVVELNRLVGQALDVYVGEELVAKGEVVVMPDATFGARVIKVLPIATEMNQNFANVNGEK